jgi:hypothetical protein
MPRWVVPSAIDPKLTRVRFHAIGGARRPPGRGNDPVIGRQSRRRMTFSSWIACRTSAVGTKRTKPQKARQRPFLGGEAGVDHAPMSMHCPMDLSNRLKALVHRYVD